MYNKEITIEVKKGCPLFSLQDYYPKCDKEITIEVLKEGDTYTIGSMTLHETLSLDELHLILDFSIDRAKKLNNFNMITVKFPDTETPVYSINIILTQIK